MCVQICSLPVGLGASDTSTLPAEDAAVGLCPTGGALLVYCALSLCYAVSVLVIDVGVQLVGRASCGLLHTPRILPASVLKMPQWDYVLQVGALLASPFLVPCQSADAVLVAQMIGKACRRAVGCWLTS